MKNFDSHADYDKKLSARFGLDHHFNHDIIEALRFLFEDTEDAIEDYEEFGLQGPTRNKTNIGERYLRLYGFLTAIYSQRSIITQLAEIFKLDKKKEYKEKIDSSKLIRFRSNAAAHSVDDINKDYFRLVQSSLRDGDDEIQYLNRNNSHKIDLKKELQNFKLIFHNILLVEFELIVAKLFIKASKNYKELIKFLDLIEHQMKGKLVILMGNGEYQKIE